MGETKNQAGTVCAKKEKHTHHPRIKNALLKITQRSSEGSGLTKARRSPPSCWPPCLLLLLLLFVGYLLDWVD
jgi:hypothetical protein